VARPQVWQPAAVFFPLGYPFPYGPGSHPAVFILRKGFYPGITGCKKTFKPSEREKGRRRDETTTGQCWSKVKDTIAKHERQNSQTLERPFIHVFEFLFY
jgi:hypothetical protein